MHDEVEKESNICYSIIFHVKSYTVTVVIPQFFYIIPYTYDSI